MDSATLDQPCEHCQMSHGHHTAWCVNSPKVKSDVPPQGRILGSPERKVNPPGINAEGAALVAKDVPIK